MEVIIYIFIFLIGISLGSFYACIGYRIPNKISTIKPRSFCTKCKEPLKWYMNIPLFSYIFLKGKCHYCKEKISLLYLITELLTGILFLISYIYFDLTLDFFKSIVLISVLAVTLNTDIKYYYISDRVIVVSLLTILGIYLYYLNAKDIVYYIVSAIVMFGIMFSIKLLGDKIFKRESLGGGDIKLMLLVGLSLGIIDAVTSLLISSTLALLFSIVTIKKNEDKILPFGPFLITGTIIMIVLSFNNITII